MLKYLRTGLYKKITILSLTICIFFYAASYQSMAWESRFDIEEYEEKWIKKSCRRSYKEAPFWKGFWKVYGKQSGSIIRQSIFFIFLSFLWPWNCSMWVGGCVLILLSLKAFNEYCFIRKPSEKGEKWVYWYGSILGKLGSAYILMSLTFLVWGICQMINIDWQDDFISLGMCMYVSIPQASSQKIFDNGIIKIEESEHAYWFTIGGLHWQVSKENSFDFKAFCVLMLTALDEENKPVISARKLREAMEIKGHDILTGWVKLYEGEGNTLEALSGNEKKPYGTKIRMELLAILKENPRLSLLEIQEKLQAKGFLEITQEQVKAGLSKINYLELYEAWDTREWPCEGSKFSTFGESLEVKIEKKENGNRIYLGNLYWDIEKDNQFGLASLLEILVKAKDYNNRKITGTKKLGQMLECTNWQDVQKLLGRYDEVAKRFRTLSHVEETIVREQEDQRLREIILKIWLDDISLSPQDIEKKLQEQGESVKAEKIRELMREVDFLPILKRWNKEYQKGNYKKSSKWLIEQYRNFSEELINQMFQGKIQEKAQIDKYIGTIASIEGKQNDENKGKEKAKAYKNLAWLKCFLFNLPKTLDGKVCCPNCGSFETKRRSLVPENKIVLDAKTGEQRQVQTYRFRCCNELCSSQTFTASPDNEHILEEERYAKACLMLRLYLGMKGSCRSIADLLGTSKSVVYDELTSFSYMALHWQEALGTIHFSGTLCIDEKFVKIKDIKKINPKHPFAYIFFAVDPMTYDIIHIELFATRDHNSAVLFLQHLKAKGVYPTTIMTDLTACYDAAVREVYGRSVTLARCHFHFQKNIFDHMNKQFGKKDIPEIAKELKTKIFHVVDANSRKTIKMRNQDLLAEKEQYLQKEPRLLPMFTCLENYLPHLLRVIENLRVTISTNNDCERVIRNFNQRYKIMGSFKSLKTARRHVQIFHLFYRFTPLSQDVEDINKRGKAPLQIAGYNIESMPIFHYLSSPLLFNIKPAQSLALLKMQEAS